MELNTLQATALTHITSATTLKELDDTRVHYLGQKGEITLLLKELGTLAPEERKTRGAAVNAVRVAVTEALESKKTALENAALATQLAAEAVDITLPGDTLAMGKIHPLTAAMEDIAASLRKLGFVHAYGPEVETDDYNFGKLNFHAEHPARQDQDTFFLKQTETDTLGIRRLLRTQTSNVQVRALEAVKPPFRVMGIGRVFRRDYDLTHTPQFHQVEGMMVDKGVTMGTMRAVLSAFLRDYFGKDLKTRMRPHYFPFTEPSAEMDMECVFCNQKGCRVCKGSGWLEILGCGMVHRNVLAVGGIKNLEDATGFAFGAGVERLAMLKYGIGDLRLFFESHGNFLQTFGKSPVTTA